MGVRVSTHCRVRCHLTFSYRPRLHLSASFFMDVPQNDCKITAFFSLIQVITPNFFRYSLSSSCIPAILYLWNRTKLTISSRSGPGSTSVSMRRSALNVDVFD